MANPEEFDVLIREVAKTIKDLRASISLQEDLVRKLGDQYFRAKFGLRLGDILLDDNDWEYQLVGFDWPIPQVLHQGASLATVECYPLVVMIRRDGFVGKVAHRLNPWKKKAGEQ